MVIEHTFVTTVDASQALGLAVSLLSHAGFVASQPAPPVSDLPALYPGPALNVVEMTRATVGQKGSVPCLQNVRLEFDRGRVTIAATIFPSTGTRPSMSATSDVTGPSAIERPFADAMMALALALDQALAQGMPIEQALEPWKALDALLTVRVASRRKTVRRCALCVCAVLAMISVGAAMGRAFGSHHVFIGARQTMTFPENEDPRTDARAVADTFAQTGLEQLRAEADAELRSAKSHGRGDVSAVFAYADRLARAGAPAKALHIYEAALKCAPADYPHHLSYADLLNRQNQRQAALAQARIVLGGAEDVSVIQKAQAMVGGANVDIKPLTALPGGKPILVVVPMGDVDLSLLEPERQKLQDELGIDVQVRSMAMSFPVVMRNLMKEWADRVRADFAKVQRDKPELYARGMLYLGFSTNDLQDDVKAVSLAAYLCRLRNMPEAAAQLEALGNKSETQWLADSLVEGFTAAVRPFSQAKIRFLGVTRSDMFGDNTDYLYSYRVGEYAVVSYHRFTASFNKETPDRTRLARRLHVQLLANAGHVFGLEPCTNPTCPRYSSFGLAEHDAKSEKLCEKCRKDFDGAVGRSASR